LGHFLVSEPASGTPWRPWSPAEVASRLSGVDVPWAFAAGWAVDLFLGETTREHEDVEVTVPSASFPKLAEALRPGEFQFVAGEHQSWLKLGGAFRLDVFREPHDGDTWICRRDPSIRRPYREVVGRTADGLPFVVPEIVLLFKAKAVRPKDELDFERVRPRLSAGATRWLRTSLERVHPGHPWLELLPK
jgi:aminoglycoside-2''-adenylyltransferase